MDELGLTCLIALDRMVRLRPSAVLEALREAAPRSGVSVDPRAAGRDQSAVAFTIDRQEFAAIAMPGRLPDDVFASAVRNGIFWAGAKAAMDPHQAFIIVTAAEAVAGKGLVRAQAVAMTRAVAALLRTAPALGVVWHGGAGAEVAVPPARFDHALADLAKERWPVDVWLAYRVFGGVREGQKLIGAQTQGAARYFGGEIQVAPIATSDPGEVLRIIVNTASHVMGQGQMMRSGQTLQVRGERVMMLEVIPPTRDKPGLIRLVDRTAQQQAG